MAKYNVKVTVEYEYEVEADSEFEAEAEGWKYEESDYARFATVYSIEVDEVEDYSEEADDE